MRSPIHGLREKVAFLGVGTTAAASYVLLGQGLSWIGFAPALASVVAYLLCIPLAYLCQRWITFRSTRPHGTALSRYFATQGIGLTIATAVVSLASTAGLSAITAFCAAAVLASALSFFLQKHWVY